MRKLRFFGGSFLVAALFFGAGIFSFAHAANPALVIPNPYAVPQTWSFDRSTVKTPIGDETMKDVKYKKTDILNEYYLSQNKLYKNSRFATPTVTEQKVWNLFVSIAGLDLINKNIRTYATYKIPNEPTLAFVARIDDKDPPFNLVINTNAADFTNKVWARDMAITLTHEYAHLLTLNRTEVRYANGQKAKCLKDKLYITKNGGCSYSDSYINAFTKAFWTEQLQAKAKQRSWVGATYYASNKDKFTSVYAATNPEEDIAESFTDFVLRSKPTGTQIKDKKILFFYNYPELVKLRDSIRSAIGSYVNKK